MSAVAWETFASNLDYVPLAAGAAALKAAVQKAEQAFGAESRRLHYLSVPPSAALLALRLYAPGSWGPNAIHQLVAPRAWRLPFERVWRDLNHLGS